MSGPANQTSAASEPSPTPYNTIRRMSFRTIGPLPFCLFSARGVSRVARDHHLDAAVLRAPFRGGVGGDRNVRPLAVDFDAVGIGQAGLEQRGHRLGPLHGGMPVRR